MRGVYEGRVILRKKKKMGESFPSAHEKKTLFLAFLIKTKWNTQLVMHSFNLDSGVVCLK